MLRKYRGVLFPPILCLTALLLIAVSCTAPVKQDQDPGNGRLQAENSAMKRRLPLVERENDILNKENAQYRKKIQDLESFNQNLIADLATLSEQYARDKAAGEEQVRNLRLTIEEIENEKTEKIEALIALNTALGDKMDQAVDKLKDKLGKQKNTFAHEREQILQESAKKESELAAQIEDVKKKLKSKELEISSLKLAIGEISAKLGEATALADALRKTRNEAVDELNAVKAINAELTRKMNALYDELAQRKGPVKAN